jgi:hypothetical protein
MAQVSHAERMSQWSFRHNHARRHVQRQPQAKLNAMRVNCRGTCASTLWRTRAMIPLSIIVLPQLVMPVHGGPKSLVILLLSDLLDLWKASR